VQIIALLNEVTEDARNQCLAAGIDECVSPPITLGALCAALKPREEAPSESAAR
jgi:CheY-like chemotaxis protein